MKTYIAPGVRSPFVKAGTAFSSLDGIGVSIPVVTRMTDIATPDVMAWGQVIPDPRISNLGRELALDVGLNPNIPAFSTQLACSTSMMATIQVCGMLGRGGVDLGLVGGVETMSRIPIALKPEVSQALMSEFASDPAAAAASLQKSNASDFDLPVKGWANRITQRSMGEHTEDTAKFFGVSREDQDELAFKSHSNAAAARTAGFFDDLIVEVHGVQRDALVREDTSVKRLATLKPVFDRSPAGTLTAGNSSPLTDGAAALWVANEEGLKRFNPTGVVQLVDWQLAAMEINQEGILMAPARAISRLLARHKLRLEDIALFEIHEAFAAQVLANIYAITDKDYRLEKAGVDFDLGDFPWERLNVNGGSLAIGHPFGATGARILSQAAKALSAQDSGSRALVSICADGGQGTVVLLQKP